MKRKVVGVVAFLSATVVSWAQMDMLPFMFRDIAPEIEQGLPAEMSYAEFRELNRNVDFFTMAMSMMLPGYGMFQVERPELAIPILAGRLAGYGLMAAAMVRQWDDFRDLWDLQTLSLDSFDSLKENAALMCVGVGINFFLWGVDVLGAYHIAKEERDYVIYRYGAGTTAAASSDPSLTVIRAQFRKDDALARPRTAALALVHLDGSPTPTAFGEVSLYAGILLSRLGKPEEAIAHVLRGLYVDPQGSHAFAGRSFALDLLTKYTSRWHEDRGRLWRVLQEAPTERLDGDEGIVRLLLNTPELRHGRLLDIFYLFADRYLAASAVPESGDRVLAALAASFADRRMREREAAAWAKIVTFYPASPLWTEAVAKAADAYRELGDTAAAAELEALTRAE